MASFNDLLLISNNLCSSPYNKDLCVEIPEYNGNEYARGTPPVHLYSNGYFAILSKCPSGDKATAFFLLIFLCLFCS